MTRPGCSYRRATPNIELGTKHKSRRARTLRYNRPVLACSTKSPELRATLARRALVADGAMGTMLYAKGVFINRSFDELNLSTPALISEVHRQYVEAGAEIVETNTYGANRTRLTPYGLGEKVAAINEAGVRLAREAAGEAVFVAGSMGPLGARIAPIGRIAFPEARDVFLEQATALIEAGVDLLILETFSDLHELDAALQAARQAAGADFPIVAQVTIDDAGALRDGTDTETFTRQLDRWPADAIGLNCSAGPKVMLETIERMAGLTSKALTAMPNAGHPVRLEGRSLYLCSPEYMAQYARRFLDAGVRIIGGCCGTTPEHIKQVRAETRSLQPEHRRLEVAVPVAEAVAQSLPKVPVAEKSKLGAKLAQGTFVAFVEILPPRGVDAGREIAGSRLCAQNGIDCINVPDGPRASARMSAQVACQIIQQQASIEAVLHFCCRDRNILGIQSELIGAHAAGIRNLICITGDPPRMGSYPEATAVFDVDSIGLVGIVENLNRGLDIGGNPIGSRTSLLIGVGANPGAVNLDEEIRRFERKVEAGAEFAVTQPVFDLCLLEQFLRRIEHLRMPLIAGIWPLTSLRNAEFMVNELRVPVPRDYLERMRRADSADKARDEGVSIAREMVRMIRPMVRGVQLSAPFGRYQMAIDVAEAIGPR
jgi:methionine synthase / methylenetetrahydrofolate reductase(NADPH)